MLFLNYCILLVVFPVVHAHVLFVSLDSLFSFSLHHAERVKPGLIWKWRSASVRTCLGSQPYMLMYFITAWRNIGSFDWSPAGSTVCCAGVCDSRLEVWVSFQRKVSLSGQRKAINILPSLPLYKIKKKSTWDHAVKIWCSEFCSWQCPSLKVGCPSYALSTKAVVLETSPFVSK